MAMAHKAPYSTQAPVSVNDHAVDRFRERATDFLKNEGALDDQAVRYKLAWLVQHALDADKVEALFDTVENKALRCVDISDTAFGDAYALVPKDEKAVITVLTRAMVELNWGNGRWVKPDGAKRGLSTLGEKLAVQLPKLAPKPTPAPGQLPPIEELTNRTAVAVKPTLPVPPTPEPEVYERLVSWVEASGSNPRFVLVHSRAELQTLLLKLTAQTFAFKVWRSTQAKVTVSISED